MITCYINNTTNDYWSSLAKILPIDYVLLLALNEFKKHARCFIPDLSMN
jgi:hypothetical protein